MQVADRHGTSLAATGAVSRRVRNLLRMAAGPLRERGLVETVRSVRSCLHARERERTDRFDAAFGTDTERNVTAADLECTGPDVPALWRYWPTARSTFLRIMDCVHIAYERSIFVDLGSGKGRVVLMASEYPFRKIIGVELSPALHRVALRNVAAWSSPTKRCRDIELLCMDAAEFMLPADEALVYLFQPFPAETMRAVLTNLARSLAAHPRMVRLAYLNPLHHSLILGSGQLALERWGRAVEPGEFDWAIYRATAVP
jgi:SAM-dependent methyltransferase